MREDPVDAVAARPWPPLCSPTLVQEARELLEAAPVLAIVGPVGSGRNQLASDLAELPPGAPFIRHDGRYGENGLPYFALRQVLRGIAPSSAADQDDSDDPEQTARAILQDAPQQPRVLLADAYLVDDESIDVLLLLAQSGLLRLIATLTPGAIGDRERLVSAGGIVTIPPLDEATIAELLRIRFGAEPHPLVTQGLLECSAGSYAVLRDVADAFAEAGAIVELDGVLVIDPAADHAGTAQLTSLLSSRTAERLGAERPLTDLVHLTALLGSLDVAEARSCVGPEIVDDAVADGGLTIDGEVLTFSLRAEGRLVRRTVPPERRIELFDRFVDRLPRSIALRGAAAPAADWWRAANRLLPVELAGRATREANLLGHYRRALVYSDPAANERSAVVAPMERVFAFHELGDEKGLLALCVALDPRELSEDELLPYFRSTRLLDDAATRTRLHEQAVTADDPDQQHRRDAVRTLEATVHLACRSGGDKLTSRLRSLAFSADLSPGNRTISFAALAAALRHSARPAQAVKAAASALDLLVDEYESVSAYQLDLARELHIMSLVSALDVKGSEAALRAYSSGVFASAGSGRLTTVLHAYVEMARGDMSQALISARMCLKALVSHDPHQVRGWVEAMTAETLVYLGRPDAARTALADAKQHPSTVPATDLVRRIIIATCHDALAEPEEALEILAEVVDESRDRGLLMTRIEAAATSVLIDGPPLVDALLQAVALLEDPSGTPRFWEAFARAARDYDIPAIVDLADELDELGAQLFAARVAQFVLDMARRATDLEPQTRDRLRGLADLTTRRR